MSKWATKKRKLLLNICCQQSGILSIETIFAAFTQIKKLLALKLCEIDPRTASKGRLLGKISAQFQAVAQSRVDFINFICALRPCKNHRDSSIHLRPTPTPNFLRSFLLAQSWVQRFVPNFMKSTPDMLM